MKTRRGNGKLVAALTSHRGTKVALPITDETANKGDRSPEEVGRSIFAESGGRGRATSRRRRLVEREQSRNDGKRVERNRGHQHRTVTPTSSLLPAWRLR